MVTLTVKFVVENEEEASGLIDEVAEDIGNYYGTPFIFSETRESTEDEIAVYTELGI